MTTYNKDEQNAIILSSLTELTYNARFSLLSAFKTSEPDFNKNASALIKTLTASVYNKVRSNFYDERYRAKTFATLEKSGVKCVTYFSKDYPKEFINLPEPPLTLYLKGNASLLSGRKFTVVGSRVSLPQTLALCKKISAQLTQKFCVVTGLAEGADTAAITGALPEGKLISVLAHGFDRVYPASNAQLLTKIYENGLAVSEYPPEVKSSPYNFPARNRLLAALGEGTLVVSAGAKSGALITAGYAEEYSKQVFAFPYSVGVYSGKGCNNLIKNGAFLTENILDIFSVFGLDFIEKPEIPLTENEIAFINAIKQSGEGFLPEIAAKLNKAAFELIPIASSLEIKKVIVRLGGNRYGLL